MIHKLVLAALVLSVSAPVLMAEVNFDGKAFDLNSEMTKLALSVPAPAADKAHRPAKEWTIMVFVNGKNNLEQFALKDMNEMEMVGSTDKVNIVTEVGRIKGFDSSDGDWKTVRRYLVKKDTETAKVTSPVLAEFPKVDMGDYKSVIDFANWAKANYPAKKYMLILWNHGAGWIKARGLEATKGISYDDETKHNINTPQMAQILKEIGGVDVYGSDACLMQMAEVDYEIMNYVKFIVGSEETEPGDGYTYNDFLAPVAAKPAMDPEELARVAVDAYANHYAANKEGSTQSYVRTAALPGFLDAANAFAYAVTQAGEKDLAKKAMGAAQSYAYPENKDFYHFAQLVLAETKSDDVKAKGQALMSYITDTLVGYNRTTNSPGSGYWNPPANYDNSHGIAVYLPGTAAPAGYAELQWATYSNWDEFIAWLALP